MKEKLNLVNFNLTKEMIDTLIKFNNLKKELNELVRKTNLTEEEIFNKKIIEESLIKTRMNFIKEFRLNNKKEIEEYLSIKDQF